MSAPTKAQIQAAIEWLAATSLPLEEEEARRRADLKLLCANDSAKIFDSIQHAVKKVCR